MANNQARTAHIPVQALVWLAVAVPLLWIATSWFFGPLDYAVGSIDEAFVACGSPFTPTPPEQLALTPPDRYDIPVTELARLCAEARAGTSRIALFTAALGTGALVWGVRCLVRSRQSATEEEAGSTN
ncbi:hypothetical protein ACWFRB_00380 [Rhodococcus sp. NPDC055112]